MDARAVAVAGVAAATVAAGCLVPVPGVLAPAGGEGDAAPRPTWRAGDWWSYRIEVSGGGSAASAFVVHEAGPDGYRLGSNRSTGFFGIPFHGELEPDLDPRVAGERWDMFRFPLQDGETWVQRFLGHALTTEVHAASLETPGGEAVPGYRLEAQAYGVQVATYTYAPDVGWLTSFTLRDPETGETLAWANLTDRGRDYRGRYLVEEPLHHLERSYPEDTPGESRFPVDAEGVRLAATLAASSGPGLAEARLEDPTGDTVVEVGATGQDADDASETWPVVEGRWTLDHRGLGSGQVRMQLHVVREAGDGPSRDGTGTAGAPLLEESLEGLLRGADAG